MLSVQRAAQQSKQVQTGQSRASIMIDAEMSRAWSEVHENRHAEQESSTPGMHSGIKQCKPGSALAEAGQYRHCKMSASVGHMPCYDGVRLVSDAREQLKKGRHMQNVSPDAVEGGILT